MHTDDYQSSLSSSSLASCYSAQEILSDQLEQHSADVERKLAGLNDRCNTHHQSSSSLSKSSVTNSGSGRSYNSKSNDHVQQLEGIDVSAKSKTDSPQNEFSMTLDEYMQIHADTSLSTLALERMKDDIGLCAEKVAGGVIQEDQDSDNQEFDKAFGSVSSHFMNNQKKKQTKGKMNGVKRKAKTSLKESRQNGSNTRTPQEVQKSTRTKIPISARKTFGQNKNGKNPVYTSSSGSGTTLTLSEKSSETGSYMPATRNFVKFNEQRKAARKGYLDCITSTIGKCAKLAYQNMPDTEYKLLPLKNTSGKGNRKKGITENLESSSSSSTLGQAIALSLVRNQDLSCDDERYFDITSEDEEDDEYVVEKSGNCPQHGSRDIRITDAQCEGMNLANYGPRRQQNPSKYHKKLRKVMKRRINSTRRIARKIKRKDPQFYCLW